MTPLAHGVYRYWRDGAPQDIHEPWSLFQGARGLLLRGQRRQGEQVLLEIEARYAGTRCVDLHLSWQPGSAAQRQARHTARAGAQLRWQRDGDADGATLALPAPCELFPLLRAGMGPVLARLAQDPGWVVVPDLHDPQDAQRFLTPLLSQRRVVPAGEVGAGHCRYFGGEYGETGADCWTGPDGLLLRYTWASAQGHWEARLEDLETATAFAGFGAVPG